MSGPKNTTTLTRLTRDELLRAINARKDRKLNVSDLILEINREGFFYPGDNKDDPHQLKADLLRDLTLNNSSVRQALEQPGSDINKILKEIFPIDDTGAMALINGHSQNPAYLFSQLLLFASMALDLGVFAVSNSPTPEFEKILNRVFNISYDTDKHSFICTFALDAIPIINLNNATIPICTIDGPFIATYRLVQDKQNKWGFLLETVDTNNTIIHSLLKGVPATELPELVMLIAETKLRDSLRSLRELKSNPEESATPDGYIGRLFSSKATTVDKHIETLAQLFELKKAHQSTQSPTNLWHQEIDRVIAKTKENLTTQLTRLIRQKKLSEDVLEGCTHYIENIEKAIERLKPFTQTILAERVEVLSEKMLSHTEYRQTMDSWLEKNGFPPTPTTQQKPTPILAAVESPAPSKKQHTPTTLTAEGLRVSVIALENSNDKAVITSRKNENSLTRTIAEYVPDTVKNSNDHYGPDGLPNDDMMILAIALIEEQRKRDVGGTIIITKGNALGPAIVHAMRLYCDSQLYHCRDFSEHKNEVDQRMEQGRRSIFSASDTAKLLKKLRDDPDHYGYPNLQTQQETAFKAGVSPSPPRPGNG